MTRLSFFGGTKTVTGANYLLEVGKRKILVDCGLFQDPILKAKNNETFPYNPREIDVVIVTHTHLDHTGRLPKLVREGFKGKIFSTPPTLDLTRLILEDELEILSQPHRLERNDKQIFSAKDLRKTLNLFETVDYYKKVRIFPEVSFRLLDAGHILGSAIIEVDLKQSKNSIIKIIFSGDLGNSPAPLLRPTDLPTSGDYILIESAYGDKVHQDFLQRKDLLEDTIENTIKNKGVLMIPSFAIERTQEILYELNELVENQRIPPIPIFIDSPMAIKAINIYRKYNKYYNKKANYILKSGDDIFHFPNLNLIKSVKESQAIDSAPSPKIIIAGSGMSEGGRILYHEKKYLSDPKNCLLLICYQVKGTRGREIQDGKEAIEIFQEIIPVRAKIVQIQGYSAHADRNNLFSWLYQVKARALNLQKNIVKKIFVVQGEEEPAKNFSQLIKDKLGIETVIPEYGQAFEL